MKRSISYFLVLTCLFIMAGCTAFLYEEPEYSGSITVFHPDGTITGEQIIENKFITATDESIYVSLDNNTAAYPYIRKKILVGETVPKDLVRTEEILNYFHYDLPEPTNGEKFSVTAEMGKAPWNSLNYLLTIGVKAEEMTFSNNTANNLVFLLDVSGSMNSQDKLPLVQQSFGFLVEALTENDTISIVTYAGSSAVVLEGAKGNEKTKILEAIYSLEASGSTAGSQGINDAYRLARQYYIENGNNRVILATDGDFNVGISDPNSLKEFISEKRDSGIYLSTVGFGDGNYKDATLETLALNGNGNYSYIDSVTEAKKVFVEEIGGNLVTIAKDVKSSVTFNKEYVSSYRLIGFENKLLTSQEYHNANKDAGEIGSSHEVIIAFEVSLKPEVNISPDIEKLITFEMKYKKPENDESVTKQYNFNGDIYRTLNSDSFKFASCVIEMSLLLRDSNYQGTASYSYILIRLNTISSLANDEYKQEFKELIQKLADQSKVNR